MNDDYTPEGYPRKYPRFAERARERLADRSRVEAYASFMDQLESSMVRESEERDAARGRRIA